MTTPNDNKAAYRTTATTTKPTEPESIVGNFLIKEKIGQGSFASVYKAQHKDTGQYVAIKSVLRSKLTKKLLENLESEITILKAIRHDHIVGLSECHKTNTHIHLVMDYCSLGDLSQYIKRIRNNKSTRGPLGGLPENTVRHFLKQLASALQFLRSQNLVHRDIKPQNLLLVSPKKSSSSTDNNNDELPTLQVADFGFARFLPNASLADTLCGSPLYMGPEILSYKKYDAKADLWSVGAVLYEMMTGRSPFRAQNHLELLKKIQDNNDKIQFPDEKTGECLMGEDLKDLVRKLLKKDPVERISFEEFFNHRAIIINQPIDIISVKPTTSTSSSSSKHRKSSFSRHPPNSLPARLNSPIHPMSKVNNNNSNHYEPPPFANNNAATTSSPYQDRRLSAHIPNSTSANGWPIRNDSDRLVSRNRNSSEETSPNYSRARSAKVEFKDNSHNDMHESGAVHKRTNKYGEEEDVLREYVVLDRRTIETNQFADELNASPRSDQSGFESPRRPSSVGQVAIPRRKSSTSSDQTGYPPSSVSPGTTPPFVLSRERRISAGALAKAISMASVRLFGTGHSPPNYNRLQKTMVGSPRGFMLMGKWGGGGMDHNQHPHFLDDDEDEEEDEEDETIAMIERIACMGHAVAKFADSKFELLLNGRNNNNNSNNNNGIGVGGGSNTDSILAAEALMLHVKALSLLELGFKTAKLYWKKYQLDLQQQNQSQPSPSGKEPMVSKSIRLNDAVQWMRERFNECLDRATFEKTKCDQDEYSDCLNGNNTCVEKLLYDRALELSRSAAVHELVGENIAECEQDYRTAIWMLEAILEVGDDKDVTIEEDDRRIINKFIDSIKQRITVLRKKVHEQKDQYSYHLLNQNRFYEEN